MRKWTYLVAALTLMGATTVLTGCLDNEEPAGITDLRGAKAEFIRAKVAYENALTAIKLVQVEKDKVGVELSKVTLELNKLTLEEAKAQTEYEKERIKLEMTNLAEEMKGKLLELQEKTLVAEKAYQEALVALEVSNLQNRDDQFEAIISPVITAIQGIRTNLTTQNGDLNTLEGKLIAAKAQYGKAYRGGLVLDSMKFENGILVQKEMLEIYKAMKQNPVTEWIKQIVVIDNQLADISVKSIELSNEIAKKANNLKPIQDEIAQLKMKKAVEDKIVTIPVVEAAIQHNFINRFINSTLEQTKSGDFYKLNDLGKYEMTAAYTSKPTSLTKLNQNQAVSSALITIENYYENTFKNTYNITFGIYPNEIAAEHVAKAKAKLAELSLDADKKNVIYKADSTAWDKTLKAYKAAAKAYGYELNSYADRLKDLNDYRALAADKQTEAVRDALKAKLIAYYAVRVPVDNLLTNGVQIASVMIGTENTRIDKALSSAGFTDALFEATLNNYGNTAFLGTSIDLTNSSQNVALPIDAKTDGAIQAYVRASQKVYNTSTQLGNARETAMTEEDYLKLDAQGSVPSQGSFFTYMKASQGVYIFNTIESWLALSESMEAIDKGFDDQLLAITNDITAKEASFAGEDDKMYRLEVERYLLDGTNLSSNNPYSEVYSTPTKKSLLTQLKSDINTNTGSASAPISFRYYTVSSGGVGSWINGYQIIESIVPTCETAIQNTLKFLDIKKAEIEAFDKGLVNGTSGWESIAKNLEDQIAVQKTLIEETTANLSQKEAQLKGYLDAYAKK